jgi:hypothetical protein
VHYTGNGFVRDVMDYEVYSTNIFFHIMCINIVHMDY